MKNKIIFSLFFGIIFCFILLNFVSAVNDYMVVIPAGNFQMGSTTQCVSSVFCSPVTSVNVDSFNMDKYEVTNQLWNEVVTWGQAHGYDFSYSFNGQASSFTATSNNLPVHHKAWHVLLVWSNARSEMEGLTPVYYTSSSKSSVLKKITSPTMAVTNNMVNWNANGYRLSTEAEWEYASRGGLADKRFPWGDEGDLTKANYCNGGVSCESSGIAPKIVGSYPANGYGLFDIAGNVAEWVWDCHDNYAGMSANNPKKDSGDGKCQRVRRGGASSWSINYVQNSYRASLWPEWSGSYNSMGAKTGFRNVRKYSPEDFQDNPNKIVSKDYMIIDLTKSGADSIGYLDAAPTSGWTDEYKTTKLVLRKVPAGTFNMGSVSKAGMLSNDHGETLHQVNINYDYYIGVFKITQAQYQLVMGNNPSKAVYSGNLKPVTNVEWSKASGSSWPASSWPGNPSSSSFSGKLKTKTGIQFDLPTEAMWEKACKADSTKDYNNNVDWSGDPSTFSVPSNLQEVCGGDFTALYNVGIKKPNAWGLYDFHCNAREWVLDYIPSTGNAIETSSLQVNPAGLTYAQASAYVSGGGSVKRMTKNDMTTGIAGSRCADKEVDYWNSPWTAADHIYGPSFRVAAVAPAPISIPECTSSDWSPSLSSSTCPKEGIRTITWIKNNQNCINGVQHNASEIETCVYNPTWEEKDDDGDSINNANDKCENTATGIKVNLKGCPLPRLGNYRASSLGYADLNAVNNFEIKNDLASIKFNYEISLVRSGDQLNIEDYVSLETNKITLDSNNLPELNVPATLIFNNVNFEDPVILKNGILCSDCTLNYNGDVAVVSVSSFSTYELVERSYYEQYLKPVVNVNQTQPIICTPVWNCSSWTNCSEGNQDRMCSDENNCNLSLSKPSENQNCSIIVNKVCTPNWQCSEFTPEICPEEKYRARECSDKNNCNVNTGKPVEKQDCIFKKQIDWPPIIFSIVIILLLVIGFLVYYKFFKNKKPEEKPVQQNFSQRNQFGKPLPPRRFVPNNSKRF